VSAAPPVGLCLACAHSRRVESRRGSVFLLCELANRDPSFARYPRLPVLQCSGFTAIARNDPTPEN